MYWAFRFVGAIFAIIFNLFASVIRLLVSSGQLRRIRRQNENLRGVEERYEPTPITSLLSGITPAGKVMISGNDHESPSPWRNAVTSKVTATVHRTGTGIVVLHNGNIDLVARLQEEIAPENLVIVDKSNPIYDPLRDYTLPECMEILTGSQICDGYDINSASRMYLRGMLMYFIIGLKRKPYLRALQTLADKDFSFVQEKLQTWLGQSKIDADDYERMNNAFMGGLSGHEQLREYLHALYKQMQSVAVNENIPDTSMTSIRRAACEGKTLVLDVSSVLKYKLGYALIMNELNAALEECQNIYLVIDNLEFNSCDAMRERVMTSGGGVGVCVSAADLFARCASKQESLDTLVSASESCFVFRHAGGGSAEAWQKKFGTYEMTDITYNDNAGKMKASPFVLFSGRVSNTGRTYARKIEPRVKANMVQQLPEGVVFVNVKGLSTIIHSALADR